MFGQKLPAVLDASETRNRDGKQCLCPSPLSLSSTCSCKSHATWRVSALWSLFRNQHRVPEKNKPNVFVISSRKPERFS